MKTVKELEMLLSRGSCREILARLYCCREADADHEGERYLGVLKGLEETYGPHGSAALFSAPGRTEIGGNHTDHQHGCVLAGSVNMDMIAAAAPNGLAVMRLTSEGYDPIEVHLGSLEKRPEEENTSLAILRGTCRAFRDRGAVLSGLDLYISSNVPRGSGISSSAAFEVLLGTAFNELLLGGKLTPVEIARIGQWTENVYFGKPCGLMDQMASSVGGAVGIDFGDPAAPVVTPVRLDLEAAGLDLCILDSGADHADLTAAYAAVPAECRAAARVCGGEVLRDVPFEVFLRKLPEVRTACGDRAVLRALHFYEENRRAQQELAALQEKDYPRFLALVNASGHSSWEYLQNVTPPGDPARQAVALTIAVAKQALGGRGAVRVHGGGFAGTVQAFVPREQTAAFREAVEAVLGKGTCHVMAIRPLGGVRLL